MKWYFPILVLYSVFIILLEYNYGQDHVRHYLTDSQGPVLLFGIHTTITTILLSITSYNFLLCYFFAKDTKVEKIDYKLFFISQSILFLYLALDERFMLHERIGFVLGIRDAYPLLLVAIAEAFLLLYFKEIRIASIKWKSTLVMGAVCFSIMVIIDTFAPLNSPLRLSFEDLFKLWGIFFLFKYSCAKYLIWVQKIKLKN